MQSAARRTPCSIHPLAGAALGCVLAACAPPRPDLPVAPRAAGSEDAPRSIIFHENGWQLFRSCVLHEGKLIFAPADYDVTTGDTTINGRPFREVYPPDGPGYASPLPWFQAGEPIPFEGRTMVKFGPPTVRVIREVRHVGTHRGALLFTDAETVGPPDVIYVMVAPGCVFQPYHPREHVGAVRG